MMRLQLWLQQYQSELLDREPTEKMLQAKWSRAVNAAGEAIGKIKNKYGKFFEKMVKRS